MVEYVKFSIRILFALEKLAVWQNYGSNGNYENYKIYANYVSYENYENYVYFFKVLYRSIDSSFFKFPIFMYVF